MLIYAAMLGCLDPISTIAGAMTSRSPFVSPLDKRMQADEAKANFGLRRATCCAALHRAVPCPCAVRCSAALWRDVA